MTFTNQIKPWWEQYGRQVTVKTDDGVTADTRCLEVRCPYPDRLMLRWRRFVFEIGGRLPVDPVALALLKTGKVTELCVDGSWYRVTYKTGTIGVTATTSRPLTIDECLQITRGLDVDAEPIPGRMMTQQSGNSSSAQSSAKEKILEVISSAPDGLTWRQISDQVDCGKQWLFSCLNVLMRSGNVTKHGTVYKSSAQNATRVCVE